MALQRALTHRRLFHTTTAKKISTLSLRNPFPSSFLEKTLVPPDSSRTTFNREYVSVPDSTDQVFFRKFLQKRTFYQSDVQTLPNGENFMNKLKSMDINRDRVQLGTLNLPIHSLEKKNGIVISVDDAKKLFKLSQLETLKSTLRKIPQDSITYPEFLQICIDSTRINQGSELAKALDESGSVIVLGNIVFLRPEQLTKAIKSIIPLPIWDKNDPRKTEFENMEKEKEIIDAKAEVLVKRELWSGLGLLVLQTAGFMRLTFWELSWDVMEPICFFVTSVYFMAGYAFFLRTSKDPSFEGFFQSRFGAKQKKLMMYYNFDVERYNELKRAYHFSASASTSVSKTSSSSPFIHTDPPASLTCALPQK
ncbi:calcium uniporter protein 2, mitochondrial-like [Papaver somniferum]|uniref:calcium uniporter protein 2, mitochondrial-like n=1 Tax=Papaver somniferum TaxID=3469 RepID=UPI000E6FBAC7|nr:calcium uniporter protein 2, mitochondrial-like [Papaver somniferum]